MYLVNGGYQLWCIRKNGCMTWYIWDLVENVQTCCSDVYACDCMWYALIGVRPWGVWELISRSPCCVFRSKHAFSPVADTPGRLPVRRPTEPDGTISDGQRCSPLRQRVDRWQSTRGHVVPRGPLLVPVPSVSDSRTIYWRLSRGYFWCT